jgi:hypothetical protein
LLICRIFGALDAFQRNASRKLLTPAFPRTVMGSDDELFGKGIVGDGRSECPTDLHREGASHQLRKRVPNLACNLEPRTDELELVGERLQPSRLSKCDASVVLVMGEAPRDKCGTRTSQIGPPQRDRAPDLRFFLVVLADRCANRQRDVIVSTSPVRT